MSYKRSDNRKVDQLRNFKITRNYLNDPEGSVLVELGNTKVICTATIDHKVPQFIRESGAKHGWLTAEYDMLPRSANRRILRDRYQGKIKREKPGDPTIDWTFSTSCIRFNTDT